MTLLRIIPLLIVGLFISTQQSRGQNPPQVTIAFYNLENLFDPSDNPNTLDEDRTPTGKDRWTPERLAEKYTRLAEVLAQFGGAALIGVCEVEQVSVLQALVAQPAIAQWNYQIIHQDSPDPRGIDVALLYRPDLFEPWEYRAIPVHLTESNGMRRFTRDILLVEGLLYTGDPDITPEQIWVGVNHWPSRSGGQSRSNPYRVKAAQTALRAMDSIRRAYPEAKILHMGDFNDDPSSESFAQVLQATSKPQDSSWNRLFNPMIELDKRGLGSLAYRDRWSLFDQFFMTQTLANTTAGWQFQRASIFSHPRLVTQNGRFKGYPNRTYNGGTYNGGYSDHFPILLALVWVDEEK